jgi:ketosteroid isomerase-like protein
MSRENVEVVEAGMEHFGATGEPQWSLNHEDIEVHDHDLPDAGDYRGHAGYARWLEDWADVWSEYSLDTEEFIDAGDRVVVVFRLKATGRGSGVTVERRDGMVVTLRDGLAVRVDYYNSREQALEAVGLAT